MMSFVKRGPYLVDVMGGNYDDASRVTLHAVRS